LFEQLLGQLLESCKIRQVTTEREIPRNYLGTTTKQIENIRENIKINIFWKMKNRVLGQFLGKFIGPKATSNVLAKFAGAF
jgi:hypothetical protein